MIFGAMEERERFRQPVFVVLAMAIVLAPFLALLFDVKVGLGLMTVALITCGLLLRGAAAGAPPRVQRWIQLVVAVNLLLAVACGVALVYLLKTGG